MFTGRNVFDILSQDLHHCRRSVVETEVKKKRGFLDSIPGAIIMYFVLLIAGSCAGYPVSAFGSSFSDSNPAIYAFCSYAYFIGIWIVTLLLILAVKKDRIFIKKLKLGSGGTSFKAALAGLISGFAMNGLCILAAGLNGDIHIYFNGGSVPAFFLILFAVCIQSGAEELVCRFYIYQHLKRGFKSEYAAVIISALMFTLGHIFNSGVTVLALVNITLIGLLYALVIYYFDAFWFCALNHTLWNYTQNIIFGLPNSGIVSSYSIFRLDASTAADSFFYNVNFGVESTCMATIVILIAIACVIFFGSAKKSGTVSNPA